MVSERFDKVNSSPTTGSQLYRKIVALSLVKNNVRRLKQTLVCK